MLVYCDDFSDFQFLSIRYRNNNSNLDARAARAGRFGVRIRRYGTGDDRQVCGWHEQSARLSRDTHLSVSITWRFSRRSSTVVNYLRNISVEVPKCVHLRYRLPVMAVVFNNNGIYRGLRAEDQKELEGDLTQMWAVPFFVMLCPDFSIYVNIVKYIVKVSSFMW